MTQPHDPNMWIKKVVTIATIMLITYLAIAGTIAKDLNFTLLATSLVTFLGLMWGNPFNRNGGE